MFSIIILSVTYNIFSEYCFLMDLMHGNPLHATQEKKLVLLRYAQDYTLSNSERKLAQRGNGPFFMIY